MKNIVLILFLCFPFCTVNNVYADTTGTTNTVTLSYPATSGSYINVYLAPPQSTTNHTCSANNTGLLFMDPTTHTLQICVNGQPNAVPYPETCFNQFSNSVINSAHPCPSGYSQTTVITGGAQDHFITTPPYTVYSDVCCTTNSLVLAP